jgi:calcineurin-like phosphoesterase family protein
MNTSSHYLTADTHFGHKNILKSSRRPFDTIEDHDIAIVTNIVDTMKPGDILWHLGDVAFRKDGLDWFLHRMRQAGIHVRLIRGNHDDKIAWKARERFNAAHESLYYRFPDPKGDGTIRAYLSHYAHRTWRNSVHGAYHFFGHSHGNLPDYGRSTDVGVDCWDFKPVALTTLIAKLESAPHINHHPDNLDEDAEDAVGVLTPEAAESRGVQRAIDRVEDLIDTIPELNPVP